MNRLLKQFVQMKKMLKQIGGMAGLGKKRGGLGMMKSLMVASAIRSSLQLRVAEELKLKLKAEKDDVSHSFEADGIEEAARIFRVVVTDSRAARDSSFVEVLGHYNPRTKPETLEINRDRLEHWLKAGAQPSDTVRTLVARMPAAPAAGAPVNSRAS